MNTTHTWGLLLRCAILLTMLTCGVAGTASQPREDQPEQSRISASVVFQTPDTILYCTAFQSLTSQLICVTLSGSPQSTEHAGGYVVLIDPEHADAEPRTFRFPSGLRPSPSQWNPEGTEVLMRLGLPSGEAEWRWLTPDDQGDLQLSEPVYQTYHEGDGRALYSPCFGTDGTLYPAEHAARRAGVSVLYTKEAIRNQAYYKELAGVHLHDGSYGLRYTLFADPASELLMCWIDGEPPTVHRTRGHLLGSLLVVDHDDQWHAAAWKPSGDGSLRLPGVPGSFDAVPVADADDTLVFLGQMDSRHALLCRQSSEGTELVVITHPNF